jgi:ribosomal protein L16/L10AE
MGKGKGSHSHWIAIVKKGQVICELISDNYKKAYRALLEASSKLPVKVKITKNIY